MAAIPKRFIRLATWRLPIETPSRFRKSQHPAARKRVAEMQFVEAAHGPQILGRGWPGFVVDGASADAERLGLPGDRQVVLTVDHRLALSNPALVSAPS